jgi:hypothetical protein
MLCLLAMRGDAMQVFRFARRVLEGANPKSRLTKRTPSKRVRFVLSLCVKSYRRLEGSFIFMLDTLVHYHVRACTRRLRFHGDMCIRFNLITDDLIRALQILVSRFRSHAFSCFAS